MASNSKPASQQHHSAYGAGPQSTRPLSEAQRQRARAEAREKREALPLALIVRDAIQHDHTHGIPPRSNAPLVLDHGGKPELPDYILGRKPRAWVAAIRRLEAHDRQAHMVLTRYYIDHDSEDAIARELEIPRNQVRDARARGLGYIMACLDTDAEHSRLRGITLDMLYEDDPDGVPEAAYGG